MIEKREDCIKGEIMKKIGVIIPLSIAVVIIGMVVFTQLYQDKKQKEDKYIVTVSNWNGMEKRYAVCEIETDKDVDKNFTPVYLVLSEEVVEMYQSEGYNLLSYLFDNYDFADAKEFYERFTKDIVQIDEENKQISVSGYDPFDDIMIEKCITLDFTNHTVIGKDKEGKEIVIDGK